MNDVYADRRAFADFCTNAADRFDRVGQTTGCCDLARAEALRWAAAAIIRADHKAG